MESFDVVVTTGFFKLYSFEVSFGSKLSQLDSGSGYEVPSGIESAIVNAVLVGEIVGLGLCGWVAERFGFRRTLTGALVLVSLFLLLLFFAEHVAMFIVGQFLCGIPLGVFQTLPATYASEILPTSLKPYLTTYVNFCWAFGGLLGSAIQRATLKMPAQWSWRLPIALQWVWPIPLMVGVLLAPESPWWLVRRGQSEEALKSLERLTPRPESDLEVIEETNRHEQEVTAGAGYLDCFRGGNWRRTEATSAVWAIQMICGSTLMYFSTVFFEEAGLGTNKSYTLTPVLYGIGCAGTIVSWFLIAKYGRKMLYFWGNLLMAIVLFTMGVAGLLSSHVAARWAAAIMLICFTLVYDCSVGPVCYCLVTELPSSRLKQKTVAMARCIYLILSIIMNVLVPRMLGSLKGEWNWGPKSGFVFGGGCVLSLLWVWLRLPETKGKSVEEIDIMFEQKRHTKEEA